MQVSLRVETPCQGWHDMMVVLRGVVDAGEMLLAQDELLIGDKINSVDL